MRFVLKVDMAMCARWKCASAADCCLCI